MSNLCEWVITGHEMVFPNFQKLRFFQDAVILFDWTSGTETAAWREINWAGDFSAENQLLHVT